MNVIAPGRIVRFTFPDGEEAPNHVRTVPAVVTAVHSDDCVNLRLFSDGEPRKLEWRTSVERSDEEGTPGKWAWPPRADAAK